MAGKGDEQGVLVVIKENHKQFKIHVRNWLAKQPLPVEAAFFGAVGAVAGGAASYSLDLIYSAFSWSRNIQKVDLPLVPTLPINIGGGPKEARIIATFTGACLSICSVTRRLRNKEDVYNGMVAGLGAGVIVSLFSGINGTKAITNGVFCALLMGGNYKLVMEQMRKKQA